METTCLTCGVLQLQTYYYRQTNGGFMLDCKSCWRKKVTYYREANIDRVREYDRDRASLPHRVAAREAYTQTTEGKAAMRRGSKAWIVRNPAKRKAQVIAGNAIRDGKLVRQQCEACGKEQAQAHHDDYSKPLDVRWLCTTHHAEWHKQNTTKCPPQSEAA